MHWVALQHETIQGTNEVRMLAAILFTVPAEHLSPLFASKSAKHIRRKIELSPYGLLRRINSCKRSVLFRVIHSLGDNYLPSLSQQGCDGDSLRISAMSK